MNMKRTPGSRLRQARNLLGVSRAYLQEKHSLPEVTLGAWETDRICLTDDGAQRCIEIFKKEGILVSKEWLLIGIGLEPKFIKDVESYFNQSVSREEIALNQHYDEDFCMMRDVKQFESNYPHAATMIVSGDEMQPLYSSGDYIGGFKKNIIDTDRFQYSLGKDCIIQLKSGERCFRRLIKGKKGYNLAAINPLTHNAEPVIYNAELEFAAPVVWHRKRDA